MRACCRRVPVVVLGNDLLAARIVHIGLIPDSAGCKLGTARIRQLVDAGSQLDGLGVGHVIIRRVDRGGFSVDKSALHSKAHILIVPFVFRHIGKRQFCCQYADRQRRQQQRQQQYGGKYPPGGNRFHWQPPSYKESYRSRPKLGRELRS